MASKCVFDGLVERHRLALGPGSGERLLAESGASDGEGRVQARALVWPEQSPELPIDRGCRADQCQRNGEQDDERNHEGVKSTGHYPGAVA